MLTKCPFLWVMLFLPELTLGQTVGNMAPEDVEIEPAPPPIQSPLLPANSGRAIMIPTGWIGSGNYLFTSLGGSFPQIYSNDPDLIFSTGIGLGNAIKAVQLLAVLNVNDVSQFSNFSGSMVLSRQLRQGSSISTGIIHAFADRDISDTGPSVFFAYSHAAQGLPSGRQGYSRLSYTLGIGSGRFVEKSDEDVRRGKAKYGTAVFAGLSYELLPNLSLNAEWTGLNLCASVGWRPFRFMPPLVFGLADITRLTGERPRFVAGIGFTIRLPDFQ